MDKIAILLPVFNGSRFLKSQIQTIQNQKKVNFDIFISIDRSSDNSKSICHQLSKKYKNIKVLKHNKVFGSASRNFLYLLTNVDFKDYKYISLTDQDDLWFKDKLINSKKKIKQGYDVYSSSVIALTNKKKHYINKSQKQTENDFLFESGGPGSTYFFNRSFADSLKRFLIINNKKVFKFNHYDWLIYSYARKKKFKWFIDKKPTLLYRQHENNEMGANISLDSFINRGKEIIKGDGLKKAIILDKITGKKLNIKNRFSFIKLLPSSFSFRRKLTDKFLLLFYFICLIFFGNITKKKISINLKGLINFFYILSAIIFFYYLFLNYDYFANYTLTLFPNSIYILILFILLNFTTSLRITEVINIFSKKKIFLLYFLEIFAKTQLLGFIIPAGGFLSRTAILNSDFKIKINQILGSYFLLIFIDVVLIFSSIFIIDSKFDLFLYLILFTTISLFFLNRVRLNNLNFIHFNEILKSINNILCKKKLFLKIIFISIIKFLLLVSVVKTLCTLLNYNFDLRLVLIFSIFQYILDIVKITPQNLFIGEYLFSLIAKFSLYNSFDGIILKLFYRLFENFTYLMISSYKLIKIKIKIKKI